MSKDIEYSNPPSSGTPLGLYSQIARVQPGELVFIAGQLATGDFEAQFRAVFEQIGAILGDLGTDFQSIAKFTTYLTDPEDIPVFMKLREEAFPGLFGGGAFPPNTLLIVQRLVKPEFRIEVEAIARLPG
jgi:enamine deaminase RidA (YjgF/YER057c/UK114 family)